MYKRKRSIIKKILLFLYFNESRVVNSFGLHLTRVDVVSYVEDVLIMFYRIYIWPVWAVHDVK